MSSLSGRDINNPFLFVYYAAIALCSFVLAHCFMKFLYIAFLSLLVQSKNFLYQFCWIFSARRNSLVNTDQTSENIFTYIKTIYVETMIKYSLHSNSLQFLFYQHSNIPPRDLQLKIRNNTERSKIILQRTDKLLLQGRIHINRVMHDSLKNSTEQLASQRLESINIDGSEIRIILLRRIHRESHNKSSDLTKKKTYGNMINWSTRTKECATNILDKRKCVINISSRH